MSERPPIQWTRQSGSRSKGSPRPAPRQTERLPVLVRFLMRHALIGFGIAILFVAALLGVDAKGLRTLMLASPDGLLAAGVLTFAMGLTFSSVQMGIAVMLLPDR